MADRSLTLRALADMVGGEVEGDASIRVSAIAPIDSAGESDITFADDRRFARLGESKAAAAIVGRNAPQAGIALVRVDDIDAAVSAALGHFAPPEDLPAEGIHPSAAIAPDASIGSGARIGPNVVISSRARIGNGCVLCAGSSVGARSVLGSDVLLAEGAVIKHDCTIGDRVRIGPNSVIGWDGFGYHTVAGVHHRVPHGGGVAIEDDVELGACCCVDRAKFGATRVGAGTKVDNLVQIAHGVQVGRGCILVAQVGIAGSARLGQYVVLGGNVGVRDNVSIGDGAQAAAFSAIAGDVAAGEIVAGIPAGPARHKLRVIQATEKLPDLIKRIKELETRLSALESSKNH